TRSPRGDARVFRRSRAGWPPTTIGARLSIGRRHPRRRRPRRRDAPLVDVTTETNFNRLHRTRRTRGPRAAQPEETPMTTHAHASSAGLKFSYRAAGRPDAPTILLLHGFPTSSHMFRDLIPRLADRWHVVAPDLPGFGFSDAPDRASFPYTFDRLARVIHPFTEGVAPRACANSVLDSGAAA